MLFKDLLTHALHEQRDDFQTFARKQESDLSHYLEVLSRLESASEDVILERTALSENPGCVPSLELTQNGSFTFKFREKWQNHEDARRWASSVLEKRTTFAADASQILPGREISLPVAAIQVGWFENPHDDSKSYEKNAEFKVLSPRQLLENQDEPMNPETRVGELRFHAEAAKARDFLLKARGWQDRGERTPLAFFDGTLLVSFSLPRTNLQESFVRAMVELVRLSRETRVPLVGYVDSSYSRDLLNLADAFEGNRDFGERTLYDANILCSSAAGTGPVLQNWGDRTSFCYSRRRGLSAFDDPETGLSEVGFVYLKTTGEGVPARLDLPSWIFEEGLLEEVIDIVRAECVIGLGYPYALETADQTAVISVRDREIFLGALQEFANREKLNFTVSRKSASKGRRR